MSRRRALRLLAVLALVASACSSAPSTVATIDGIEIERARFESLHPEGYEPVPDETASSLLLIMIHDVFLATAEEDLGVVVDPEAAAVAFENRTRVARSIGDVDTLLANRGVTQARVQLEADLDALRDALGPVLVRREAPGFDIEAAYRDYLLNEARVCVRQIRLDDTADVALIIERANAGEVFADLAREYSTDPLAQREEGLSGAGGDMGCSFPNSFGIGLAQASLNTEVPVGEAFGPVLGATGVHIMVVYEREIPDLSEVRAEVVESAIEAQSSEVFNQWAIDVLKNAEVTIDAAYGEWGPLPETNGIPTVIPVEG